MIYRVLDLNPCRAEYHAEWVLGFLFSQILGIRVKSAGGSGRLGAGCDDAYSGK